MKVEEILSAVSRMLRADVEVEVETVSSGRKVILLANGRFLGSAVGECQEVALYKAIRTAVGNMAAWFDGRA